MPMPDQMIWEPYRMSPFLSRAMEMMKERGKKEPLVVKGPEQYKLPFEFSALESPVAPPLSAQQTPSNISNPYGPLSSPF